MPKDALVAPAATVTLAGTDAKSGCPLVSVTTAPPAGAGAVSRTVPVDEVPPVTVAGFSVREDSALGEGVIPEIFDTKPSFCALSIPRKFGWNEPGVAGKFVEVVVPPT